MGAKRWVDLGITRIQPSEMMKLGLLLAISRYFHGLSMDQVKKTIFLFVPIILVILPTIVVLSQPDLGTGVILILIGISIFFIAGVQIWKFILALIASVIATPYLWNFLHSYQQERESQEHMRPRHLRNRFQYWLIGWRHPRRSCACRTLHPDWCPQE